MWINDRVPSDGWIDFHPEINFESARTRIEGVVDATPIRSLPVTASGIQALGKMENRQKTGSFKSRGASNNIAALTPQERARGVVASSSGNHGQALAWAAKASGVPAYIVMPENAYVNKIEACRAHGAEVILAPNRLRADELAQELAAEGKVWVHPYDRPGTVEGAGTVGLEIHDALPEVDVVLMCVGGGGLSAGSALAIRRRCEEGGRPQPILIGVEPSGAATMDAGLHAGRSVRIEPITSSVQGLTTPFAGELNLSINRRVLDAVMSVPDDAIYAAQRVLVNDDPAQDWERETVEPAGAAAYTLVSDGRFPARLRQLLEERGRPAADVGSLSMVLTISGGNPAPDQIARLRA